MYQLQTGTSITTAQSSEPDYDATVPYDASSSPGDTIDACAAPNSSGPNSGPNDNCEWTVQPGFNFDTVTLTTVSAGTVSLEGSSDFGNNPDFDCDVLPFEQCADADQRHGHHERGHPGVRQRADQRQRP